jgi:hypothetical protein
MNIICTAEAANVPVVAQGVALANQILARPDFYVGIAQQQQFDLSNATPAQVANILRSSPLTFTVDLFTPGLLGGMLRYRKTLAYTDGAYPNTLFLNSRKLNRAAEEIAATIIHESVHAVDDAETTYTFGHGNNSAVGKKNTAPYWIGNYAYQLLLAAVGAPVAVLVFDQEDTMG